MGKYVRNIRREMLLFLSLPVFYRARMLSWYSCIKMEFTESKWQISTNINFQNGSILSQLFSFRFFFIFEEIVKVQTAIIIKIGRRLWNSWW